jgi:Uma2 family endonuclease
MSVAQTIEPPAAAPPLVTAEQLLAMPDDGLRRELLAGRVVTMAPAGDGHGRTEMRLTVAVFNWADAHRLGQVWPGDTGFVLARHPDTVRSPDGAFVVAQRVPPESERYAEVVPDLVWEVVSPSDRPSEVLAKVGVWLDAGVQVVWVVRPARRQVDVYDADGGHAVLAVGDTLTCPSLLPGFAFPVAAIWR